MKYSVGDWVFYNNPGHQFHMMFFQIFTITAAYAPVYHLEYRLKYGSRDVVAFSHEIILKGDQTVYLPPGMTVNENACLDTASGEDLDKLGALYGVARTKTHEGHEVVENFAGGKPFKYCRKCKVEVL